MEENVEFFEQNDNRSAELVFLLFFYRSVKVQAFVVFESDYWEVTFELKIFDFVHLVAKLQKQDTDQED